MHIERALEDCTTESNATMLVLFYWAMYHTSDFHMIGTFFVKKLNESYTLKK